MNLAGERDKALWKAYAFARQGNQVWAQLWMDRAAQFLPGTARQLAYANRLLRAAQENREAG
jgi:hypothetical protein